MESRRFFFVVQVVATQRFSCSLSHPDPSRKESDFSGSNPHPRRIQGGPLPSYKWSYKSIYRGYNPSYPVTSPFIRVITPFITGRGPPCRNIGVIPFLGHTWIHRGFQSLPKSDDHVLPVVTQTWVFYS